MGNADKMNTDEHSNHPTGQTKSANQVISKKTVAITYFGGLLLALIITWGLGGFSPGDWTGAHYFPMGCLFYFAFVGQSESGGFMFVGYAIYIAIFICAFIFRKKSFFITLLVIYILILCLNISSCAMVLNGRVFTGAV
jgi:hypothetical protein